MDCALLMAHQHVTNGSVHEDVIDFQHHATWVAEDGVHPFFLKAFDKDLCTAFLHRKLPPQTLHHRESVPVCSAHQQVLRTLSAPPDEVLVRSAITGRRTQSPTYRTVDAEAGFRRLQKPSKQPC
jgi:hypothetical protein